MAAGSTEQEYQRNKAYNFLYTHTGDLWGVTGSAERVEPGFEINRIGYIQKEANRGWNKAATLVRISPRINKYHIRRITTNLEYEYNQDLFTTRYIDSWLDRYPAFIPDRTFGSVINDSHGDRSIGDGVRKSNNFMVGGDATVNLINEMSVAAEFKYFTATELTGSYSGNRVLLTYSTRPINLGPKYAGTISVQSGTYYNFERQYAGDQRGLNITGKARLGRNILTELQSGFTNTFDGSGEHDGQYFNLSSNTTWMFTKDFFLRIHAQGILGTTYYTLKETDNDYLLSCLLSWEYRPGSFMYLGYNEARFDELNPLISNRLEFKNRTLIFKVSYFFSI